MTVKADERPRARLPKMPKKTNAAVMPEAPYVKADPEQILGSLKPLARGWDQKLAQDVLSLPPSLYKRSREAELFFSSSKNFDIIDVVNTMMADPNDVGKHFQGGTNFGIGIYERGPSNYFVYYNEKDRIVVSALLSNFHDTPSQKEWVPILESIKSARAIAKQNKDKIVCDRHAPVLLPQA